MPRASRKDADAVRRYLDAVASKGSKRGRRRTPESITKRLEAIEAALPEASSLQRLRLVQERLDLRGELAALDAADDIGPLEEGFVASAGAFAEANGITYAAWREAGVPSEVLRRAGIKQTRRRG